MELNDSQKIAVSHFEGPMMVLAGPGSGKTRVITHRVRFLIEEKHVDPSNILVITFTKAAAVEMRQRYHQMMPSYGMPVLFSTFHSIFFTILNILVKNIYVKTNKYIKLIKTKKIMLAKKAIHTICHYIN